MSDLETTIVRVSVIAYTFVLCGYFAWLDWTRNREAPTEAPPPPAEDEDDMADYVQQVLPLQQQAAPELIAKLQETAIQLAAGGAEITSDDIHARVKIPAGIDPRIMGAAFHPRKAWEAVGWKPSVRPECNKRPVRVWRLRGTPKPAH